MATNSISVFPFLTVTVTEGGTVPAINFTNNITRFVNIGSGNVLKLAWNTPVAANNEVDSYNIHIEAYDKVTGVTQQAYKSAIGKVNEFYITSNMLAGINFDHYQLNIYLTVNSKYGVSYGSTTGITAQISKGCGTYTKVTDPTSDIQLMKRSIALNKLSYKVLTDAEGKALKNNDGNFIYIKSSTGQDDSTGWTLMRDFYVKDPDNNWQSSDIQYEVLLDVNGEVVYDINNSEIYML